MEPKIESEARSHKDYLEISLSAQVLYIRANDR